MYYLPVRCLRVVPPRALLAGVVAQAVVLVGPMPQSVAESTDATRPDATAPTVLAGELRAVAMDVVGPSVSRRQHQRLSRLARAASMAIFTPLRERRSNTPASVEETRHACRSLKLRRHGSRCAVEAASVVSAVALARSGDVDVTFVSIGSPAQARRLDRRAEGRIVALAPLRRAAGIRRHRWNGALRRAARSRRVDLGVAPLGSGRVHALRALLPQMRPSGDDAAPRPPGRPVLTADAGGRLHVQWSDPRPRHRRVSYGVYRDGRYMGSSHRRVLTLDRLACGASQLIEVDAVDRAGNRSSKRSAVASIAACGQGVTPSTPGGSRPPSPSWPPWLPRLPLPPLPPATVFLSPSGDDGRSCRTAAAACRSLDRAYEVAGLGEVVELAGGSYGDQRMEGAQAPERTVAAPVVFRPAPGAAVALGRTEIDVPHVEFRGIEFAEFNARHLAGDERYAAGDLTFRNITTRHFALNGVHDVRVLGADVGPNRHPDGAWAAQDGIYVGAYPPDQHVPANIVLDGVYVHDIREPTASAHSDCIQFTAGVNVVVRNSRFENCEHADLMIKPDQGPIAGFLIENNFLGRTLSAYYSINLYETSRGCRDVVMRHNSALQNIRTDACSGGTMIGNIQPSMSSHTCSTATVAVSRNVYRSGAPCGAHDLVANVRFADEAVLDLHLSPGSAAIDRGAPGAAPSHDIDGQPRIGAPDAGADELG
jgi:hypothetical protein